MSASVTSEVLRTTASVVRSSSPNSGTSSSEATYFSSPSPASSDWLICGAPGDAQLVLAHGLVHALAQQAVQYLGPHLATEALLDHLGGHLAGAEALDADGARDLAQAAAHLVVHVPGGQAEDDAAFKVTGGFDRTCMMR